MEIYPDGGRSPIGSIHWNGSDWINLNTNNLANNITWCGGNPQGRYKAVFKKQKNN